MHTKLLSVVALALFHVLRSVARERLGVSAGLRGNGMGFSREVLREIPHDAFSIVEDVEYAIRLGRAGHRVHFVAEAAVYGEMVASEKAFAICDRAVQVHGGYGYTREFAAERHLRDVRVTRIYEGTSEVQRMVIARSLLR